jgi:hypothetical protein
MPFSFNIKSKLHRSLSAWANPAGDQSDCATPKNVPMVLIICAMAHHYRLVSTISTQICMSHVVVRNSCPRRINRVVAIDMQKLVPRDHTAVAAEP